MTKKSYLIDAGLPGNFPSGGALETVSGKNEFSRCQDPLFG
jgi:hypothetical protein